MNTEERIKRNLIKGNTEMPNPATYSIKTDLAMPIDETLLPLAKQILAEYLETGIKTIN